SIPDHFVFMDKITIEISSPLTDFCESFANGIFKKTIRMGSNMLDVASIKIDNQTVNSENVILYALSPIVAHSTLLRTDGRKYTCFFQPGEEDFRRIVAENLRKKYRAYINEEPPAGEIVIRPLQTPRQHIVKYKEFIIKGYTCRLQITGPKELIQVGVDAGLGCKNSQGFGCVRLG
ncbi:MAG: CRISPR-associated endoribonuclease Cas6, partial [Clostridiales bacterium]|nr:CRISPR-associated endoribonuclease Cas6 [Clostridiales bacterium]